MHLKICTLIERTFQVFDRICVFISSLLYVNHFLTLSETLKCTESNFDDFAQHKQSILGAKIFLGASRLLHPPLSTIKKGKERILDDFCVVS